MNNRGTAIVQMPEVSSVAAPTVGRKILMAITGLAFVGFAGGHMIGNLQLFLGQAQYNGYAAALQSLGPIIWIVRFTLLALLVVHVWTGLRLFWDNYKARPVGYAKEETLEASFSSRTMIYSGGAMFLYVIYHILHFTMLVTNPEFADLHDPNGLHDVYSMVVLGFLNPWVSGVYILAMVALAFHVNHAIPSFLQTLGLSHTRWRNALKRLGNLVALVLFFGYCSLPVAVLLGQITTSAGGH
ncbi:MAG: succinate dehydrogenase cytochrome b subunit [candidate division Zixibacteria bacterium]|nr:succinate dehydrogenase cytochrome b subunit [candidate division Zixibacteria bacterium]